VASATPSGGMKEIMTNEAISAVLEHLCNEARNSVHATLGVMELLRDESEDTERRVTLSIGRASADQLLRSIDDLRDLLSGAPPFPGALEQFDLVGCTSDIIEALTLASGKHAKHMVLDPPFDPIPVTHNRKALEQVLARILDTAFKLAHTSDVRVSLAYCPGKTIVRLSLAARDTDLALLLTKWLNSNPEKATLQDPFEVPFGVAVMVAGKRLRSLNASAELVRDSAGHAVVVLNIPSQGCGIDGGFEGGLALSGLEAQPDALNILVVEDCDDSFALTEMMLRSERVWRAHDSQEALRMIQKRRFDLVFMDVHMPGMDGYTAIRNMREWETETRNARTTMVILSSDDTETQRRSAAQCGCSGFLRKPLHRADLAELLERLKQVRRPVV
jgi:CheY-like chemotaxis protein